MGQYCLRLSAFYLYLTEAGTTIFNHKLESEEKNLEVFSSEIYRDNLILATTENISLSRIQDQRKNKSDNLCHTMEALKCFSITKPYRSYASRLDEKIEASSLERMTSG
jgi:hypothetical protein